MRLEPSSRSAPVSPAAVWTMGVVFRRVNSVKRPLASFPALIYVPGMMLRPETCRAARGLLDWTQKQLSDAARVAITTVRGFEKGDKVPILHNLIAIQSALETAGVEFLIEDGGGPGVRLRSGVQGSLFETKIRGRDGDGRLRRRGPSTAPPVSEAA